jgi:uncharacterized protein
MTPALLLLAMTAMQAPSSPEPVAAPFPLSAVKILGGPFQESQNATASYLLELEPARLLAGFRVNSGLPANAEIYGGWETGGLSGHSLGHYLTACAQQYAATGDERFKQRVDVVVAELAECQKARPDGFLAAFRFNEGFDRDRLDKIWADVARGEIRSGGFDLNGMWSPWYVHHKIFAGLLDAHTLCGNGTALEVAEKFAGWAHEITKNLSPDQWQQMLGTEYGGMNESLAELYFRTKNPTHLDLARKFYDNRVLEPLARGEDNLAGKHSNTQIPKLIGLARLYEITKNAGDRHTAAFFWDRVVNHHTYVIGGNSNGEYFGPPGELSERLSTNTCETCNTYNMLKLTRHLFAWNPRVEHMDFYERAYLNHILASQDPASGMVTYFVPLSTGASRRYSNKFDNFTCCHGSGMENHTKHGDSAYFHSGGKTLWVNLFMATELTWKETGLILRQETNFPHDGKVTLTVVEGDPAEFEMRIRHPRWADEAIEFRINGERSAVSEAPGYISIDRTWSPGDTLEFSMPMALRAEAMPDNPKRVALLYGPTVLAADLGAPRRGRQETTSVERTPVLVSHERPLHEWLKPVPGERLRFTTVDAARPSDLSFAPFFSLTHNRYGVYFDKFTPSEWEAKEASYRAEEERLRDLEARTVSSIVIGQMQPERDHNLTQERNDVRDTNGRSYRTPLSGGWFEFDMKVDPEATQDLVFTFWGNDRIRPDFQVLVDGREVASDRLEGRPKNQFFDVEYPLQLDLTRGKTTLRVRVQAREGRSGPSTTGASIVRQKLS